tara:strand:- start:12341 stop:17821 length:5481 start_codon:yes stop_codon:yes gene_type:complete
VSYDPFAALEEQESAYDPFAPLEEEQEYDPFAPLEEEQEYDPFSSLEETTGPVSGDPRDEGFFPILSRTIDELQASSWAGVRVLGEAFDSEALIDVGNRGVEVNDRQIAKRGRPLIAEEVEDLGDAMTFIKQGIAQILPSVAVSMPTAIGGGKAGAALGSFAGPVGTAVGALVGAGVGAFLPSFVMSTGEIDREMKARAGDDYEDPGAAMTGGAVVAALDVASIAFGLKPLMPVLLKKASIKQVTQKLIEEGVEKGVAKAAVAQALKASLMEGATEASQEFVEDFTAEMSTEIASEEGQLQSALLNAFLLGSLGGGTLGGVSGAISQFGVNQRKKSEREVAEQMQVIEDEVKDQVNIAGETWQDMDRDTLVEEAINRGLVPGQKGFRKNSSKEKIIEKLTEYEVFNRRAEMQYNYFLENFGALTAQEQTARKDRREELTALAKEENGIKDLMKLADEKVQVTEEGMPNIKLIPTLNRKMSTNELVNKILDVELLEQRALTGGASILYAAGQTYAFKAKLALLQEAKVKDLRAQMKVRGITAKKGGTKKEFAEQIMNHDAFLVLHKERKMRLLTGEGYSKFNQMRIRRRGGPAEDINFYTVTERGWKDSQPEQEGLTKDQKNEMLDREWEAFVQKSLSQEGDAVGVRYTEDGVNMRFLDETTNIRQDENKPNMQYEIRDVEIDESGEPFNIASGTGLFNNYENSVTNDSVVTNVSEIRFEQSPDIIRSSDFFAGMLGTLKHYFAPSGPLGWEAFMLSRNRIGRIRAMNKMADQMGTQVKMAISAAVLNGEYLTEQQAEAALLSALRRSVKRFARTKDEVKALKKEEVSLLADIKKQRSLVKNITLFREGGLKFEDASPLVQEDLKNYNSKRKLEQLNLELAIMKGDLEEVGLMLNPDARLKPTQAAYTLEPSLRDSFIELRGFVDMMSKRLLRELPGELLTNKKGGKELGEVIEENIGSYMTRSYRIFEPGSNYDPLSWWNRTMPTKSAEIMRGKVEGVKKLLESRVDKNGERLYTDAQIRQEIRLLAQGTQASLATTDLGGILNQTIVEQNQEEVAIDDVARKILKRRTRIPKEIRALMGEVTSPGEAAAVTTARLSSLLENNRFWQNLAVLNEQPGQRLFSPVPVSKGSVEGKNLTWFARGQGLSHKVVSTGNNPFEGMYTTKAVAEVLGVQTNENTALSNNAIWRNFLIKPKSYIQLGKIVLSPPAQIRNFLSAALFVVGNGHFTGYRHLSEAIKVVGNELFEGGVDAQGRPITARQRAQETYRELLALGVLNTSVSLGDVLSVWRMAGSGMFEGPGDFAAVTGNPFKKFYKGAERAYTAADDFWKVVAYGSELKAIEEQFKTEADYNQLLAHAKDLGMSYTIDRQDFKTARRELAAFKVRQTVPNYDYVGKFAEVVRTGPLAWLGNFIAFPTEIVRTSANIMEIGFRELGSSNTAVQRRGFARLSGYGAASFGIASAVQAIGQALHDIDDEDIEAGRHFLPPFSKNNLIIPIEKKTQEEGGGFDYIDGSYIMVYDDLARMVPTILQTVGEAKEQGRSSADSIALAMGKTIGTFFEPFMEPSIYTQAVLDVAQNRNSSTGRPIWNEAEGRGLPLDGAGARSVALANYFWDKSAPGIIAAGEKVYRGSQEGEGAYGRFGSKQELGDAWLSFVGIKVNRLNPTSSLSFSLSDLLNESRDAEKIFSRKVYNRGKISPQELVDAYTAMQKSNYFINESLLSTFKAAERLNINEDILNKALKERLSSKQRRMIRNEENLALKPRKSLRGDQKDFDENTEKIEAAEGLPSGRVFPLDDLVEVYNYFKDLPLASPYQGSVVREEEFRSSEE